MKRTSLPPLRTASLALLILLTGCVNLAPPYQVPVVDTPIAFKEGSGAWVPGAPADALDRGDWWTLFDDPVLNDLASQVDFSNQNVAAALAAYALARAITREQRAALFPQVNLNSSHNITGGPDRSTTRSYQFNIGASWEPDVFGRLHLAVESAQASQQGAEADIASARLAAQGELATDYFNLRQTDVAIGLQRQTIAGFQRSLQITRNRYEAGVVARTDVLQAESQLASSQADLLTLERQRATFEHAIAVLVGKAPANFALAADPKWSVQVPGVPEEMPSTLLQRRPDIASAERQVAQANLQIGVQRAGYFPSFNLTGSISSAASTFGNLFRASSLAWAVGSSVAQTLFDAGATTARVEQARASLNQAAARYRQVVLTAFQDIEDQLVALRTLRGQQGLRLEASRAADLVEQQTLNRYQVGQINYTDVITAQQNALAARRALVQAEIDRQLAVVALIQGLGGGWGGLGTTDTSARL
ncbi:efflux transporter outer membrane subunit [Ramlibacter sp.]|uniref:efflux transporter outer membrane subunit n=1 Tax=Ramlibacter sp. TaxID=1917967 RepID=UPI002613F82D|nr:efflux transporter outer membrane subunit [Ramlibacter sp.]MDB5956144.1 transporter [Ramlibacter sp.]